MVRDFTFTVDETGKVTSTGSVTEDWVLLMEDTRIRVRISKVDAEDGSRLKGAVIRVIDSEGNVFKEWTSDGEVYEMEGLKTGEEYTVHEVTAPDGYTIADDFTFTVDETGKVTSTCSVTEDGSRLKGAVIRVIDSKGNVVEEWTSDGEVYEMEGLKTGEEYTVHEVTASDGYTIADDFTFTVDETGKVTSTCSVTEDGILLVEDAKTYIRVSKVDAEDGSCLEGTGIQVIDSKGNVVEEWTSDGEVHEIEGLKTGEEYTIHEVTAPDGYTIAADITFTVDETGKVTSTGSVTEDGILLVEDDMTVTRILKADEDGNILAGAKLQVQDTEGSVAAEWTSGSGIMTLKGLNILEHYFLVEKKAPSGFKITDLIEFYLKEDGTIVCVSGGRVEDNCLVMIDTKITTGRKTRTDDDMDAALWAALAAAAGTGIMVLGGRKKKRQN